MLFFTSISLNYLPKARVLAKSVKRHCPNSLFYVVLCDELPSGFKLENEPFDSVYLIKDLGLPVDNLNQWIFMHSVVELCTAVKGQSFLKFFNDEKVDKIVYLDPDTVVFDNLNELSDLLDKHSVIITPHLSELDENYFVHELGCMLHGVFNLGFLAVRRSVEGIRIIKWWRDRLISFCYDDIPNGMFTDQKWMDLAPALFDDVYILKDKAYNVAYWNISRRYLKLEEDGNYYIDHRRMKFYHFSGFDSNKHEEVLKMHGKDYKDICTLVEWYKVEQRKEGQDRLGKVACAYDYFNNKEKVTNVHRTVYRIRQDLRDYFINPYEIKADKKDFYSWCKSQK